MEATKVAAHTPECMAPFKRGNHFRYCHKAATTFNTEGTPRCEKHASVATPRKAAA